MLSVIGISYGPQWLSEEAILAIKEADTIIGYQGFIDKINYLFKSDARTVNSFHDIRENENFLIAGVRYAVEAVDKDQKTIVISNGDAGIFGMAGAVYRDLLLINRIVMLKKTSVYPGIYDFQLAASRLGGPLSNGFAVLALCIAEIDEASVNRKILGCAVGDFVTVVYMLRHNAESNPELHPEITNPRELSNLRIMKMISTFQEYRKNDAPCVIVTGLGGDKEQLLKVSLGVLASHVDDIIDDSILLIGNSDILEFDNFLVAPTW